MHHILNDGGNCLISDVTVFGFKTICSLDLYTFNVMFWCRLQKKKTRKNKQNKKQIHTHTNCETTVIKILDFLNSDPNDIVKTSFVEYLVWFGF